MVYLLEKKHPLLQNAP